MMEKCIINDRMIVLLGDALLLSRKMSRNLLKTGEKH